MNTLLILIIIGTIGAIWYYYRKESMNDFPIYSEWELAQSQFGRPMYDTVAQGGNRNKFVERRRTHMVMQ